MSTPRTTRQAIDNGTLFDIRSLRDSRRVWSFPAADSVEEALRWAWNLDGDVVGGPTLEAGEPFEVVRHLPSSDPWGGCSVVETVRTGPSINDLMLNPPAELVELMGKQVSRSASKRIVHQWIARTGGAV